MNGQNQSQFLRTDGGKTKSNAIEIPSVSLPKGGGALKGIDEQFTVNAVNGTASFSIPLPVSPARGASPALSLSYNSGAGNGIFGLGWNLALPSVRRKTDKGLPQYLDDIDSDTFIFSGAEDLVAEFRKDATGHFLINAAGEYIINETDAADGLFTIRYYKPRIEGLFARIERWSSKTSGEKKWKITTKDNVTTLFGWTINARIAHPLDAGKILEWLPEFVFDDKGNCAHYTYKKEDSTRFDELQLHHRNRIKNNLITYTNLYPDSIRYGNLHPYKLFGDPFPPEADYLFQTVFDYSPQTGDNAFETIKDWDFRPDAFSDYKAGFEIRTTRLCRRVLLFHIFEELALKQDRSDKKTLVRAIHFEYDTSTEQDFTFLRSATSYGYIKKADGSYSYKRLPPIAFDYQKHDWNKEIKTVTANALTDAPAGFDGQQYQFTDLYNEGLSGILTGQGNGWYYKRNLGNAVFEPAEPVSPKPSFSGPGTTFQLSDLDADGRKQLGCFTAGQAGFFELDEQEQWQEFRPFKALPNIDFNDPNTRWIDLDGDGRPEIVISEDNIFTWYASEGRAGFAAARKSVQPFDEEEGPRVLFSDSEQGICLADMSGDGMTDIVRIRNGEVCYWPNLGYGKFGTKVALDNAPFFDHPGSFNPAYLRLADIDGSGTSDIIYLGQNKFTCWKNLAGNRFGTIPFEIDLLPELHNLANVTITDLLGNGVACIVWTSPLAKDAAAPLKYIDLMNSRKPHIMIAYKNNLGKEVTLEYSPSTKFYIEDKLAGNPWVTKLHFPVHCISRTITEDKISGSRFVSDYRYHHGYYDHAEREFRGFGMVEQTDGAFFEDWKKEDAANVTGAGLHQEPVISKTWYHTGAIPAADSLQQQFEAGYWYAGLQQADPAFKHLEKFMPGISLTAATGIEDPALDRLSAPEWLEAIRACKDQALRSEIFARDAAMFGNTEAAFQKAQLPFSVTAHNWQVELVQPRGNNRHAIFMVRQSEAITYQYERNPEDPRITHNLCILSDEYGNALESASVTYPRQAVDIAASLPVIIQDAQQRTVVTYTQNQFTNDVITADAYRLRLPAASRTFELTGVAKKDTYYIPGEFAGILSDAQSKEQHYHEWEIISAGGKAQRRLLEHTRSLYYNNNLQEPLPAGRLASLALLFESYQLAYTSELLTDIYKDRADDNTLAALMAEGQFTPAADDNGNPDANWWVRSGTVQYLQATENPSLAQSRFYSPVAYTDPYGAITKVTYYSTYFLLVEATEDALGNKAAVVRFNCRTLAPECMRDSNNNLSATISDELGLVKAMAVMGKGQQADELLGLEEHSATEQVTVADFFAIANAAGICNTVNLHGAAQQLLQHATTRFVYDLETYMQSGAPGVVAVIARETHYRDEAGNLNPTSGLQLYFEYSNGLGAVMMKKIQAEPGVASLVQTNADNTIITGSADTSDTTAGNAAQLRWIGNGRTVKNNKGNVVKQYEPFFAVTPAFETEQELVATGVTPVMYYDAPGRLVKTEMPDGSFSKVIFDSWQQSMYDANDTVLESDWYLSRTDSRRADFITDPKEQQAAAKAARHAGTPGILHFDSQGRAILSMEHNKNSSTGADEYYSTQIKLDSEGNLRSVTDARALPENNFNGNTVMQYKYDMLGNLAYQSSMDTGQRWFLPDVLGSPLRSWDERSHEFRYHYDILHRPTENIVSGGDGTTPLHHIVSRIFYGDNEPDPEQKNIRGKVVQHYDTAGLAATPEYDFKGQPLYTNRQLFRKYKEVVNWTEDSFADLEPEIFTFTTSTDALGRITRQTAPDGSIIKPIYNQAGLLNGEQVTHINPDITTFYIKDIDYNEKGQRSRIVYGNDVITHFRYDEKTFRLKQLTTRKKNTELLQDLYYTYDPVGNITCIEDKAQPVAFSGNQLIAPINEYTYDALYRLIAASGKENDVVVPGGPCDNWNDKAFLQELNPGSPASVRNYNQYYRYDAAGNITQLKHVAGAGSWTRNYAYETGSNRLCSTQLGNSNNPASYTRYQHHAQHGFMVALPHLETIAWNFKEEVVLTIRQRCTDDQVPVTTYYQYDSSGQRIRKITEKQAAAGSMPVLKEERIYIAGYETYRTYQVNAVAFERTTLSLLDKGQRFVMVETVRQNTNAASSPSEQAGTRLIRYQLHNHQGSASLELDDSARLISYEAYHPYGTTAYQLRNSEVKAAAKRYRYTGMERDEETGLSYHSARYYIPWLGRWLSADPIGIGDGANAYCYSKCNPACRADPSGNASFGFSDTQAKRFSGIFLNSGSSSPIPQAEKGSNEEGATMKQLANSREATVFKDDPVSFKGLSALISSAGAWAPKGTGMIVAALNLYLEPARNPGNTEMSFSDRYWAQRQASTQATAFAVGLGRNTSAWMAGSDKYSLSGIEGERTQNALAISSSLLSISGRVAGGLSEIKGYMAARTEFESAMQINERALNGEFSALSKYADAKNAKSVAATTSSEVFGVLSRFRDEEVTATGLLYPELLQRGRPDPTLRLGGTSNATWFGNILNERVRRRVANAVAEGSLTNTLQWTRQGQKGVDFWLPNGASFDLFTASGNSLIKHELEYVGKVAPDGTTMINELFPLIYFR